MQTTNEFGLGLGIATLGTAVYRSNMEGALGTAPPDAADATRESVDRAVDAAGQLPAEQSGDLPAAARDAFTSGVHVVGIVSAIFYAGLAVLAVVAFRQVRSLHGDDDDTTKMDQETDPVPETASATEALTGTLVGDVELGCAAGQVARLGPPTRAQRQRRRRPEGRHRRRSQSLDATPYGLVRHVFK